MSEKIILELGCGKSRKFTNSITIDVVDLDGVDMVYDLNLGIPMEDNSVDEIYSYHFLEHVVNLQFFISEIYRVLKVGGKKIGTVPHFSNPHYYSDFTHKNFFGLYTFSYFDKNQSQFRRKVPTFYTTGIDFKIVKIDLVFKSSFIERYPVKKFFGYLFNANVYLQEFYEENLTFMFPAYEIYFEIEKI